MGLNFSSETEGMAVSALWVGRHVRTSEGGICTHQSGCAITLPLLLIPPENGFPELVPHAVATEVWPAGLSGQTPPCGTALLTSPPVASSQVLRGLAYLREKHQIMHRGKMRGSPTRATGRRLGLSHASPAGSALRCETI